MSNKKSIMTSETSLICLQNNIDVWEKLMIELVKCRKKKVNDEFYKKWEDFELTKNSWYDWEICNNSRNYIRFITDFKYYSEPFKLDYKFKNKIYVYGFEIFLECLSELLTRNNLHHKLTYLMKVNNSKEDYYNLYLKNVLFKFMCKQEEEDNLVVYCDIEKRYLREFRIKLPNNRKSEEKKQE